MPFSIARTKVKGGVDPMAPCNSDKDCTPKCPRCKSANCNNHRCICACDPKRRDQPQGYNKGMPFSIVSTEVKGGVDPMAPCNSDKDCKPKCPGCKSANCSNHRCICACEP
ncbi:hypothetical protein AAC387_Pa01g2487 [Persea americana]